MSRELYTVEQPQSGGRGNATSATSSADTEEESVTASAERMVAAERMAVAAATANLRAVEERALEERAAVMRARSGLSGASPSGLTAKDGSSFLKAVYGGSQ
jgi:hypothetical protein